MKRNGFSLVEIAIVITILGLLVGGVLAGQTLIRNSGLQSIAKEADRFKAAALIFSQKYNAIPGDMRDATVIWGSSASCPGTAGTGTQTCNGDGDGEIGWTNGAGQYNEMFTFWQHMANEGLIEGNYTGRAGALRSDHAVGLENTPRSDLDSRAVWVAGTFSETASSVFQFTTYKTENILRVGGETVNWNNGGIMTAEEAWNIDKKVDDGHASQGKVWVVRWNDCTPATSGTDYQDYDLDAPGNNCGLMFLDAF